ncbi:MAG: GGDEF domain-containing protein [Arenimonas sp.]
MRPFLLMLVVVMVVSVPAKLLAQNDNVSGSQSSLDNETTSARNDPLVNTKIPGEGGASNIGITLESDQQKKLALLAEKKYREDALIAAQRIKSLQWQVIILGSALFLLLVILALRHVYKTRHMRILAMTDELTKLPNRPHILTFLSDQAKTAYEEEQPISVIAFDIDHFKKVNEEYGHDAGDVALKTIADIANLALRRGDRVGRIGGEKFLVVLPGSPKKPAIDIAERLRCSVEVTELEKLPKGLRMTISLGVSEWNAGHETMDTFLKRADKALYEAKNSGRNQVVGN